METPPALFFPSHSPLLFLRDVRLLILEHSRWSMVEKYQALTAGLTSDELMKFSQSVRAELYAEGLVQGNFSSTVSGRQTSRLINNKISWFVIVLILSHRFLSLSSLPVHYALLCFLHRSQNSSCNMSQSKSAITPNSFPNQHQHYTIKWICLPLYAVICISFSCSIHNSPLTFFTYAFFLYTLLANFLSPFLRPHLFCSPSSFLPPLCPLTESCSSPSCQQRCLWCSEWWSFLWSGTSVRSNHSIRETPTRRSPFTTRYDHIWSTPPPLTLFQCSIIYCMPFFFPLFLISSLVPKPWGNTRWWSCWWWVLKNCVLTFLHPFCHSSVLDWVKLLSFRCTWRNPALTSSGPKRLWGECSFFFFKPFGHNKIWISVDLH